MFDRVLHATKLTQHNFYLHFFLVFSSVHKIKQESLLFFVLSLVILTFHYAYANNIGLMLDE